MRQLGLSVDRGFSTTGTELQIISEKLFSNTRLLQLLYRVEENPFASDLTQEERAAAFGSCVRLVPKMVHETYKRSFIIIMFDRFRPSTNSAFRTNDIIIDVVCPLELWSVSDKMLRPYLIMAEIEKEITDKKLAGIGRVEFKRADSILLGDELAGFTMRFEVINGR